MPKIKPKTIGIVGSRRRDTDEDFRKVLEVFNSIYREGDKIVSGGCPLGGDKFAEIIAKSKGITITIHYPDWTIGKHAGFERNTQIAEDADILIACCSEDRTGGTEDTVRKALRLEKKVLYA